MEIAARPSAQPFVPGFAPQPVQASTPPLPPPTALTAAPANPSPMPLSPRQVRYGGVPPMQRVQQLVEAGELVRAWNIANDLVGCQGGSENLSMRGAVGRLFNHPLALADLNRAITADPGNSFAVLNRAALQLRDRGSENTARADIVRVLEQEPHNPFALYCLGVHALMYRPQYEAQNLFRKLADLHPHCDAAHAALADCLRYDKKLAVSEACLALNIDRTNPVAHFVLNHWDYPGKGRKYRSDGKTADRSITNPIQALARLPIWKYEA